MSTVAEEEARDAKEDVPFGTEWTLSIPGKVEVVVTQGGTPFANGDGFSFSTFRAIAQQGKKNEIASGAVTVDDEL